jgi:NAD(P)-dependent dehydrogenase (short-subunit alcohol dehydrogenase family)
MTLPLNVDFTGKVVVVTGAGGVLCGDMARAYAQAGAKVAALDLNEEAAKKYEAEINASGGTAKAYACNVLELDVIRSVHESVLKDLGPCTVLINGAGGNNPKATTAHEYYEPGDEDRDDILTFFNIPKDSFNFVFNLNIMGILLPSQVFSKDMLGTEGCSIINISSMNAYTPLTKIPAYSSAKAAVSNFTQWLAVHFAKTGIRVNAIAPGFFATAQNRELLFNEDGTPKPKTSHTLAVVPFAVYNGPEGTEVKDLEDLGLANVAATVVKLLGYEPPKEWLESITK